MGIEENVAQAKHAEDLLELADVHLKGERFWRRLADIVAAELLPHGEGKHECPKFDKPMSDEEAFEFERREMTFGRYVGRPIGEVPVGYLLWMNESEFAIALYRYCRSKVFADRQEAGQ